MIKPKFYECGICGHFHFLDFNGDCRDFNCRFTSSDLDGAYGPLNWEEVEMPS